MFIAIIWGILVGSTVQTQFKYDHCKEIKFEGTYCELPKKLSVYENSAK